MFTACGKEETVKEKEENKKENKKENKEEIVIKKDDIEDTEEVGSSDPELEEEAAFPILNDLIDRIQLTAAPLESTGASVSVYAENLSDGARASINSSQMSARRLSASPLPSALRAAFYSSAPRRVPASLSRSRSRSASGWRRRSGCIYRRHPSPPAPPGVG